MRAVLGVRVYDDMAAFWCPQVDAQGRQASQESLEERSHTDQRGCPRCTLWGRGRLPGYHERFLASARVQRLRSCPRYPTPCGLQEKPQFAVQDLGSVRSEAKLCSGFHQGEEASDTARRGAELDIGHVVLHMR